MTLFQRSWFLRYCVWLCITTEKKIKLSIKHALHICKNHKKLLLWHTVCVRIDALSLKPYNKFSIQSISKMSVLIYCRKAKFDMQQDLFINDIANDIIGTFEPSSSLNKSFTFFLIDQLLSTSWYKTLFLLNQWISDEKF